jgi:hypothetical protein
MFNLGYFFENHEPVNLPESEIWYMRAAALGDIDAFVNLSALRMKRSRVPGVTVVDAKKLVAEASAFARKAGMLGDTIGYSNLLRIDRSLSPLERHRIARLVAQKGATIGYLVLVRESALGAGLRALYVRKCCELGICRIMSADDVAMLQNSLLPNAL